MRIAIYGGGKVGTKVAEALCQENHEITIMDADEKRIEKLQKNLDVLGIVGGVGDEEAIEKANLGKADIFIAVSSTDENNIVACLIAKRQGTQKIISRITNLAYINEKTLDTKEIGIDHVINPEKEIAKEIVRIIKSPYASEVDSFLEEKVFLVEVKVNEENLDYLDKKLKLLCKKNLIIIIESIDGEKKLGFFRDSKKVKLGDHLFIIEKEGDIENINKLFEDEYTKIQNVIIMGGGVTGEELLKQLEKAKLKVKLIEKSKKRCDVLSKIAKKSIILCNDGTDIDFLISENIEKTDCFIAITGDDEDNVMMSLLAKQKGVKKTIAKISKDYEDEVITRAGLDTTVNIRKITVNKILSFVRRKELTAISILDKDVEIMEFSVSPNSKIVRRPVEEAQFIEGAIIGAIYHDGEVFFPKNHFNIKPNDKVLVFVHKKVAKVVERYFMARK